MPWTLRSRPGWPDHSSRTKSRKLRKTLSCHSGPPFNCPALTSGWWQGKGCFLVISALGLEPCVSTFYSGYSKLCHSCSSAYGLCLDSPEPCKVSFPHHSPPSSAQGKLWQKSEGPPVHPEGKVHSAWSLCIALGVHVRSWGNSSSHGSISGSTLDTTMESGERDLGRLSLYSSEPLPCLTIGHSWTLYLFPCQSSEWMHVQVC